MLIILIFTIAIAHNTYTVHVFDRSIENNNTRYPELYAVQHIYNSVKKNITLKGNHTLIIDGRKVLCQIPITPTPYKFKIDSLIPTKNLTDEEVNYILFPLEDQCANHRTKEFLYEYCFKKYIRQYDDLNTMLNMNKLLKEDFSLGYSKEYARLTNETSGIHSPLNSNYIIDTIYHQFTRYGEQLIIIEECVARLRFYNGQFLRNSQYRIELESEDKQYNFTILFVVHNWLLILEQCSDQVIVTDFFTIVRVSQQNQPNYPVNQYYAYKNVVFGFKLRAQEMFHPQQTLGIIFTEIVHLVQVEKILDFSTILVSGFKFAGRKKKKMALMEIKNIIVMDTNAVYQEMKAPITIVENMFFFSWVDLMDVNDYITIFDNSTIFSYVETFRITGYQHGIAILDKQLTKGLRYSGKAFIKRNGQFNFAQNITEIEKPKEYNDSDPFPFKDIEINQVQMYFLNQSSQDYLIKQNYKPYMGVTFYVLPLKLAQTPQLYVSVKSKMYVTTEILFMTIPTDNIFVKSKNGPFRQMESRFQNSTIMNEQYWIIIDSISDMLYVGRGFEINLVNKVIEFKLERLTDKNDSIIFSFDKKSNEVRVEDIMLIPLEEFQAQQSDKLNGTFTSLNYTGQGAGLYEEKYDSGSFCKPINSTRSSRVTLSCYPDNLLKFLSIEEHETCEYEISIGTYLLCDHNYQVVEPSEQHIMCVLQN